MRISKVIPFLGLLVGLLTASPAFAQEPRNTPQPHSPASAPAPSKKMRFFEADDGRFYVALSVGTVDNNDRKVNSTVTSDDGSLLVDFAGTLRSEPAFDVGAKLGVRANDQVAFELESNHTKFDGRSYLKDRVTGVIPLSLRSRHIQSINFANVVINPTRHLFSLNSRDGTTVLYIEPTLIAGVGFVHESISFPALNRSFKKTGAAGNLGIGVEAKYGEMLAITLQHRYILLNNSMAGSIAEGGGEVHKIKVGRNNAHMVTAQASLNF